MFNWFEKKFVTERLIIREYRRSDIDAYVDVVRQPEIYATTCGIPKHYDRIQAEWWFKIIKENQKNDTAYEFAVTLKDSGKYIGNVGLININRMHNKADISYFVDREYMNSGFATESALAMLKYGFEQRHFNKISGICMSINPASRRVMEKIGMKYEGTLRKDLYKDGEYYDLDILGILKSEYITRCKVEKREFSTSKC